MANLCANPPIPRSGKLGFVGDYTDSVLSRFSRVRNWTYNEVANPEVRVYAGTLFGEQRIPGFVEHTGSFQGFGAVPPLFAGDEFTFIGYTAPTSGVPCTEGCAFEVPARVDSVQISWNWTAENKGVNWTINFSSTDVEVQHSAFVDPCDLDVFCDPNMCDLIFELYDGCDENQIQWCNIVSAVLTFTATNLPYSNNSTNCQIKREGGNLSWTLEVVDQNTCKIPILQRDYRIKIGATLAPDTYWDMYWGMFTGINNLVVDTENATIISKTNNFAMQAVLCCSPPELGQIIAPSGLIVWPYQIAEESSSSSSSSSSSLSA